MRKPIHVLLIAVNLSLLSHAAADDLAVLPDNASEVLKESTNDAIRKRAEEWHQLTRMQDWEDKTGRFKVQARYIDHAKDLSWVRLETASFEGSRVVRRTVDVQIDLLAPDDQERVKSIVRFKPMILADLTLVKTERETKRDEPKTEGVRTKAQQEALDSFSYEGITFGTKLTEFMTRFPNLKNLEDDALSGKSSFVVIGKEVERSFTYLHFEFLDGKLVGMSFKYKGTELDRLGGVEAIRKSLHGRFGRPDAELKKGEVWLMTTGRWLAHDREVSPDGEEVMVIMGDSPK